LLMNYVYFHFSATATTKGINKLSTIKIVKILDVQQKLTTIPSGILLSASN